MKRFILFVTSLFFCAFLFAQYEPRGLQLHDPAPDFSATDQYGHTISLSHERSKGPVVLVFYRGQWCPYCNRQLKQLEDSLSLIKAKGATVLTITPEKPENIRKTIGKTKTSSSVLHDEGLKIMKQYDVAFAVDNKTIETYKKHGIDFTEANGSLNGASLPVPAVYVVSREGKIVYRYFDTDYTKRSSVKAILEHL